MGSELQLSYFPLRLKERRNALGLSQDALSKKMEQEGEHVSVKTINTWEKTSGGVQTGPKSAHLISLCRVLDCEPEYLFGEIATPHKATADVQEQTGLSLLAVDNLISAANAPFEGPMREEISENPRDRLREFEIGRFAKIRFLELLLENDVEWEKMAVAAYDYQRQMQEFRKDDLHTVDGIRHDQFANVAKEEAKEALSRLFVKIKWDVLDGIEWKGEE